MAGPLRKYHDIFNLGVDKHGIWEDLKEYAPSTMKWCEEKYQITKWIAEFWNTTSNVWIIGPSLAGIVQCRKYGYETRFVIAFACAAAVGIGSWLFHMTLLYSTQLLDEVPMIFHSLAMAYCALLLNRPKNTLLAIFLTAFGISFTYYYIYVDRNPVLHEAVFFVAMHVSLFCGIHHSSGTDPKLQQARRLIWLGAGQSYLAFAIWNVDNIFCLKIRLLRLQFPVLTILTQGHAWWHLLIGAGLYTVMVHQLYLRQILLRRQVKLYWWMNWLPYVVATDLKRN